MRACLTASVFMAAALGAGAVLAQPAVVSLTRDTLGSLGATRGGVMATSWPGYAGPADQAQGDRDGATLGSFSADLGTGVEIWAGGVYTAYESDLNGLVAEGDVLLGQAGIDVALGESARLGLMAAGESIDGEIGAIDTDATGFLVGPYGLIGLSENIRFEGLALAGIAYSEYQAAGGLNADFESGRVLLSAGLAGSWRAAELAFRPATRLTYYAERQEAFRDSAGNSYDEETSSLGQYRLGTEVSYDLSLGGGTLLQPYAGVEGVWSFHQSDLSINGSNAAADALSASFSLGLDAALGDVTLRVDGRLDGVGSEDFDAATAEAQFRVPLN